MTLSRLPFNELLAALRSPEPTPGGGSAAALAGAVGASLLTMVAGLAKPRGTTAEDMARLSAAGALCTALAERMAALIDQDSASYGLVLAAFRQPRGTDDEKTARATRIEAAMRAATETPLAVMRACGDAIEQAAVVAAFGNPNASSDVQVALELLGAGLRGAKVNVDINLGSIRDNEFVAAAAGEAARLAAEAERGIAGARARFADAGLRL